MNSTINNLQQTIRLTRLLLVTLIASLSVLTARAQNQPVTLTANNITLLKAFESIERQTQLSIAYNQTKLDVNQKVDANFTKVPLSKVMAQLLSGTGFTYRHDGRYIIIVADKGHQASSSERGNGVVTGRVTGEDGSPVIGASVMEKGTHNGVTTDVDGNFSIKSNAPHPTLQITYIGYVSQDVRVQKAGPVKVVLVENAQALGDLVVIGYGVQKKVDVVGSISTLSSDKLENRSTPSLSNALTGQMPGVTVRQTSGSPGADGGEIRIRGVGSFGATPSALVLIDGIPGNLTDIHSDDVESISVLKDASTAAIYGSRAANGVILVTTKSGKVGRTQVAYNGYVGSSKATAIPDKVDTWEYATLYNIANGSEVYTPDEIQKFKDGSDPDNYANNRYLDQLFKSAFQSGNDLSVNGGNESNKYMLSFGHLYQDGIVKKNNYTRYNARLNLITSLWKNVVLTTRVQGVYSKRKQPNVPYGKDTDGLDAIISNSLRWPGTVPTKLSNGSYGSGEEGHGTSIYWLTTPSFKKYDSHTASLNERLDYTPVPWLKLSAIGAYSYSGSENREFRSTYKTDKITTTGNYMYDATGKDIYRTFQATADFSKSFGGHNVGALVGYSWEQDDYRYLSASRTNLPSDNYPEIDTGDADTSGNSGGGYGWALQSLFGRAKYNYMERYLGEFTFRYDGSSRFPTDNRYAFFPSVAVGWRLSEEHFIKDNFEWIHNLKLKASWGKLGNQNIGNYPYQSVYVNGYNYPFGSSLQQGVAITTATDANLHWETTRTEDIGIEGNLWNGLLSFDASYFYRKTTGILFSPSSSVSSVFGYSLSQMNMGKLENKGWEFELSHHNRIGDFEYTVSANFSIIHNKVLTLGLADVTQDNGLVGNGTYFIGYPMDIYYGYRTDGVFLSDDDIKAWPDQTAIANNAKVGDIRYVDVDGDGKVTPKDRVVLGSRIPKRTYGVSLSCSWRGIDFAAQLQGVAGVKGYLDGYAGYAFYGYGSIQRWQADGYFNPDNPVRYPAYPRLEIIQNASNNTLTSDWWVRNAAYMRVKNICLGYSLPRTITSQLGIASMRFYVQTENPFTFHHYPTGWDPEINTSGSYYPILKTYTFGINLNF